MANSRQYLTDFRILTLRDISTSFLKMSNEYRTKGLEKGFKTYGSEWQKMLFPSEEKLRIEGVVKCDVPAYTKISVVPYQWCDLQAHRQIQPVVTNRGDRHPIKFYENAVALTANALIETYDRQLVFHRKKGGAKPGSVHTFGGYVLPKDIEGDGGISKAVARELSEGSEIGLKPSEYEICGWFGTPEGMPAILWNHGTGAVYAKVRTHMTSTELQQRLYEISGEESADKRLVTVPVQDVGMLEIMESLHPQTKLVVPTIMAIYGK